MSAKEYYECHITLDPTPPRGMSVIAHQDHVEETLKLDHWTFSCIHHDIILGVGPKLYATKHFNVDRWSIEQLWEGLQYTRQCWEGSGLRVLRCKIERVVRDERYDR